MRLKTIKDTLAWGFLLWLIGYALGIILFTLVPLYLIGWIISPIGITITLYVLFKKIKASSFSYYFLLGVVWTSIAIVFDYFFLVKAFNPSDGYYKLDVYLYYSYMLLLPIFVFFWKKKSSR